MKKHRACQRLHTQKMPPLSRSGSFQPIRKSFRFTPGSSRTRSGWCRSPAAPARTRFVCSLFDFVESRTRGRISRSMHGKNHLGWWMTRFAFGMSRSDRMLTRNCRGSLSWCRAKARFDSGCAQVVRGTARSLRGCSRSVFMSSHSALGLTLCYTVPSRSHHGKTRMHHRSSHSPDGSMYLTCRTTRSESGNTGSGYSDCLDVRTPLETPGHDHWLSIPATLVRRVGRDRMAVTLRLETHP